LYSSVEDGRQIVIMALPKKNKDLEKEIVYELIFNQHNTILSKKISGF